MHTDEDGTDPPVSLARLKLLAHAGGARANRRRTYERVFIF